MLLLCSFLFAPWKEGVVEEICNLSTEEAQAGGSLVLRPAYKKKQQKEISGCCGAYL